eukprot:m.71013 g.71013  ORF g.71013 m.71013 type:complete len:1871 (-) comp7913_c1_seq2:312-5924(-)
MWLAGTTSLIAAAGGGGGGSYASFGSYYGLDGDGGPDGRKAQGSGNGGNGGINGQGGTGGNNDGGAGGAGWLSEGQGNCLGMACAKSRVGMFVGGQPPTNYAQGGFGGGGASRHQGGGGGGFSGGGGGYHTHGGGGGGGSFVVRGQSYTGGNRFSRDGAVVIRRLVQTESDSASITQGHDTVLEVTNCGKPGRFGPTEADCQYLNKQTDVWPLSISEGIHRIKVTSTDLYHVVIQGAHGGSSGGNGAWLEGEVYLEIGTILNAVVGQHGGHRPESGGSSHGYGGGGGSFLWVENATFPLMVAGGGGGYSYAGHGGRDANWDTDGGPCNPDSSSSGAGGRNGQGGSAISTSGGKGGAGGGWFSNGNCGGYYDYLCGMGRPGKFVGGQQISSGYFEGGFGGGGGVANEGGGGGGFSGGCGGHHGHGAGGGGGSYMAQEITPIKFSYHGNSHGYIRITPLNANLRRRVTTCGAKGRVGPTDKACAATYKGAELVGDMYQGTSNGIQQFKIKESGTYTFHAYGARGGYAQRYSYTPGNGAHVWGSFNLKAGDVINMVIGQFGGFSDDQYRDGNAGGGGGGGTFIWKHGSDVPMLVAGGGGGCSDADSSTTYVDGYVDSRDGRQSNNGGSGGTNGLGGLGATGNTEYVGGGGGGWRGNGQCTYYTQVCAAGRPGGFLGGEQLHPGTMQGGFGAGGGSYRYGGGGGGYSGGGGGNSGSGGGGGSFISGNSADGENGGNVHNDGYVTIDVVLGSEDKDAPPRLFYATSCGNKGKNGPTKEQCLNMYKDGSLAVFRNLTQQGFQRFEIPSTGLWKITAFGAAGGDGRNNVGYRGGLGSKVWTHMELKKGDIVNVVVGQSGRYAPGGSIDGNSGGGGGGGSFVWLEGDTEEPIIVAGGGGGGSYHSTESVFHGRNGENRANGGAAFPRGGEGGFAGAGGIGAQTNGASGGGGGWQGDAFCPYKPSFCGSGVLSSGAQGGSSHYYTYQEGGYGGGGGAFYEGGGGGGYSGGGGGYHGHGGGGGGGSFWRGIFSGAQAGGNGEFEGKVVFELPCDPGFIFSTESESCVEIDACQATPCPVDATCQDLPPPAEGDKSGRVCTCPEGFHIEQRNGVDVCADIDACVDFPCSSKDAQCIDLDPPFGNNINGRRCDCAIGYAEDAEGVCVDADACASNPCHDNAECTDLPAPAPATAEGRVCTCHATLSGDGEQCVCDAGFVLGPGDVNGAPEARPKCLPINACVNNPCDENAICTDLPAPALDNAAGRTCACIDGYSGTGEPDGCTDIDACSINPCNGIASPNQVPTTTQIPWNAGMTPFEKTIYIGDSIEFVSSDGVTHTVIQVKSTSYDVCNDGNLFQYDFSPDILATVQTPLAGFRVKVTPSVVTDYYYVNSVLEGQRCSSAGMRALIHVVERPQTENLVCYDLPPPAGAGPDGRSCECARGYQLAVKATKCVDINACDTSPCPGLNNACFDRPASLLLGSGLPPGAGPDGRACECIAGTRRDLDSENGDCVNIDACVAFPCTGSGEQVTCRDLPPPATGDSADGRVCTCRDGLTPNANNICTEADACLVAPCGAHATCTDKPAPAPIDASGRTCTCDSGYQFDAATGACVDIDACKSFPCHSSATCIDRPGQPNSVEGRECQCPTGMSLDSQDVCVDIDACTINPCHQAATCVDKPPPALAARSDRVCTCGPGYKGDGESCTNIDACLETSLACSANAICVDLPPPAGNGVDGRTCVCKQGFRGDGLICVQETSSDGTTVVAGSSGSSDSSDSDSAKQLSLVAIAMAVIVLIVMIIGIIVFSCRREPRVVTMPVGARHPEFAPQPTFRNPRQMQTRKQPQAAWSQANPMFDRSTGNPLYEETPGGVQQETSYLDVTFQDS